jgi:hypothetical protein
MAPGRLDPCFIVIRLIPKDTQPARERGMIYISVLLVERAETNFPPSISVDFENATNVCRGGGWKSCVCGRWYRSTSRILFSFFLSPREKNKKKATWKGGGSRRQTQLRLSIECALSSSCNHDAQFSFALTDRQFSEEASSRQYYLTTLSQKSINLYSFILFEIYFFELRDFSSIYLFFPLF